MSSCFMSNAGFISLNQRKLFKLSYAGAKQHIAIILPPFAEELNKTRHLINALMRELASRGISSLLLDNYGTGDSEGDLDTATADIWREDLCSLLTTLAADGCSSVSFLAVRFGALQLFDLLNRCSLPLAIRQLVLWQPIFDINRFWQQFVRLKVAEAMAAGIKLSQKELEQQLDSANTIEIAGYPVSPAFYQSLLSMNTAIPAMLLDTPVSWFETSQLDNIALPAQKMREQLQQRCQLTFTQLKAEPYWQTTELARADQLVAQTLQQLIKGNI